MTKDAKQWTMETLDELRRRKPEAEAKENNPPEAESNKAQVVDSSDHVRNNTIGTGSVRGSCSGQDGSFSDSTPISRRFAVRFSNLFSFSVLRNCNFVIGQREDACTR